MLSAAPCLELYPNVGAGSAASVYIASKCLWDIIKTYLSRQSHKHRLAPFFFLSFCAFCISRGEGNVLNSSKRAFLLFLHPYIRSALCLTNNFSDGFGTCLTEALEVTGRDQSAIRSWMELSGLRRRKWNQRKRRGCGEDHRGIIVKVTSERVINAGPGCFCQPVRWLECLMFSLLVALLCIFLCQRRWAIWTARALQRPAGSSVFLLTPPVFSLSWVPLICYDLRASWQTNLLLKKTKKKKKPRAHFLFCRAS